MVKINKIYTKTGDHGQTYLANGHKIQKTDLRLSCYGIIDELNSQLGLCRLQAVKYSNYSLEKIELLQNRLFDLGAELALAPEPTDSDKKFYISLKDSITLEKWIDECSALVPELRSFVIPGGQELNASLHIARTICRRAEISVWSLAQAEPVSENLLIFLNRLSDFLFALARRVSFETNTPEILWKPGKNL